MLDGKGRYCFYPSTLAAFVRRRGKHWDYELTRCPDIHGGTPHVRGARSAVFFFYFFMLNVVRVRLCLRGFLFESREWIRKGKGGGHAL